MYKETRAWREKLMARRAKDETSGEEEDLM